ncbi:MAG: hypothetical protein AB8H80_13955 [Planctomycetota bacterium]
MKSERDNQAGFTFAELTFAVLILVASATVLINHLSVNYLATNTERDRVFAYSKAQAMLSEIQSLVDAGGVEAAVDLDILDDGTTTKAPLTIQTDAGNPVLPDHVVSGNYQRGSDWVWSRRITVQPFLGLNNRNVRYVTVRVFKRDRAGNENAMADLSAVINSASNAFPTTQVFDVYMLAIENIPGWWVYMDSIKPFVESMVTDLENRNPGLRFRSHWITKAAFGRNQTYRPFVNEAVDSHDPVTEVYHYPGRMPTGNSSSYYYVPDNIKARINLDGDDWNGYDADTNEHPYALADFYNHAMRYPDEVALWQRRVDAIEDREEEIRDALAAGTAVPDDLNDMSKEPTLRLFLEDLNTNPAKYRNALIINLHGELLPMPAMRNYSDAAKDPVNHESWRVVTHPEQLRTLNDGTAASEHLRFRMYAYTDYPQYYSGPDRMTEPMVIEVMNLNLTDPGDVTRLSPQVRLENLRGGVLVGGTTDYFDWSPALHVDDGPNVAEEMYYEAEFIPGLEARTRIFLYNTPLTCAQDVSGRGLANSERARLYQMEYVPSPVDAGPSFTTDLFAPGALTKNTARWTLDLEPAVLAAPGDTVVAVRTRIASNRSLGEIDWETSGTTFPAMNQPDNLSTTYAWWTDSALDVPMTERSQFNGDPRHLPYLDCFNNGDDFPNSYNWYHDRLNNDSENASGDFGSIDGGRLRNRWQNQLWFDLPRCMQLYREGIVESGALYTTLTGYSNYYVGIGNDIGYDSANGYPSSIPSDMTPYAGSGTGFINTITGQRQLILTWLSAFSNWWCGYPWLGELYPDQLAADFFDTTSGAPRGNLEAGSVADLSFRFPTQNTYNTVGRTAYGTRLFNNQQRSQSRGCGAFFNIGTSSTCFNHRGASGNGTLTATGAEVAANYAMSMPTAAPVSRPFQLSRSGNGGDHWNFTPYTTRYIGSLLETYYTHPSGVGSGLVKLENPGRTSAGYVIVNGIDKTVQSGTTFIAKWAVLSLTHSFFEAGDISNTLRIPQPARVELRSPTEITELNDPTAISIQWATQWTRWDGGPYTQTGTYAEDESALDYVLVYSNDNGTTWRYMQDDSQAVIGAPPSSSLYLISDSGAGNESYTWSTPSAQFPQASYLLRIECYRRNAEVHYAWHQNRIFIQR